MNAQFPGQAHPQGTYPPAGGRRMQPGEGPLADYLQQLNFGPQLQRTAQTATTMAGQSSVKQNNAAPKLEHWTITKADVPSIANPVWRISQRCNDNLSDNDIKAKMEKRSLLSRKALKITSTEISPNQRRQVEDLVKHRNYFDLDQSSEWRLEALYQVVENRKVKAVQVILKRKTLNNPRQVGPPQCRWPAMHEVDDPKFRQRQEDIRRQQEKARYFDALNANLHGQSRADATSTVPNTVGQNHATNPPSHGHHAPQAARMFGQVDQSFHAQARTQTAAQGVGHAPQHAGSNQHRASAFAGPPNGPIKERHDESSSRKANARSKPKILHKTDSSDSSSSDWDDWDDAGHSGKESAPTEYSQHSRTSYKLRSKSPDGHRQTAHGHHDKSSKQKHASRNGTAKKKHSRHAEHDSSTSDDESSSAESFQDHIRATRTPKGRKYAAQKPEIRQHRRPSSHGLSSHESSRRDSRVSAEVRPHRSSMSYKPVSHYRGYSIGSLSSSPKDTTYYPSSRSSGRGSQEINLREWELEQKDARLEMERARTRQIEEELLERRRRMDEQELAMLRRMHRRDSIVYRT